MNHLRITVTVAVAEAYRWTSGRLGGMDESGGGRNSDEGFHISGGAVIAGAITTAVAAFVAKKLGALE